MRIAEILTGYVRVTVVGDDRQGVLASLVEQRVPLWELRSLSEGVYTFSLRLRDVRKAIAASRRERARLRFVRKIGLPFLLWRVNRRKALAAGAIFFVASLYMLSSFIWHVTIEGTSEQESVATTLRKLHVYPGGWLYKVLDQDAVQLALLDQLPNISWVGVRIRGTSVYVHVVERIPSAPIQPSAPQSLVAGVPGVVATVLADHGLPLVKPGQYVTPGQVLVSGALEDGKAVRAEGTVQAIVWYRSDIQVPVHTTELALSGQFVTHDYLVIDGFPIQVWGFSRPPYGKIEVHSHDTRFTLGDVTLPFVWRVDTVYEAYAASRTWPEHTLAERGLRFAATDALRMAGPESKVMRQNVLQRKVEHGKLYMTVWTEVLQNIAKAQPIAASPTPSRSNPNSGRTP